MSLPAIIFVVLQTDAAADGGISSISQIITRLKKHRPIIVTDRDGNRVEEWRKSGIETHVVPQSASSGVARNALGALQSYWRYALQLRKLIGESGAKVVHANDPAALQLAAIPAKLAGAKLVFNLRGTFDPENPPSRRKYRILFAAADRVLYLSRDMARRWSRHVANATASYDITYSTVDATKFRQAPVGDNDESIVLVSGLVRPLKGQLEFIRNVVPSLARESVKVWFAGDFDSARDAYMGACAEAAARFGESVKFLGYRTDLPELMARSTVIAVCSRHEGLVRAMIEGMSCGRPIVSFDVCSAREIIEEESGGAGVVVDHGDFTAMAEAILAYCRDRTARAEAGKKGQIAAQRLFAPDAVVRRYERVYEDLRSP
jgi:glycosyltransferase involved in cell wall biosynthesis